MKKILISLLTTLIIFGGLLGMAQSVSASRYAPWTNYSEPLMGSAEAPVQLVVYVDFQSPFTGPLYNNVINQIHNDFSKEQVNIRVVNFPLSFHENAFNAAKAGECANLQGNFFEYAQVMANNPQNLGQKNLMGFAQNLGLNMRQFNSCFDSEKTVVEVESDSAHGTGLGISGVPTTFVNSQRIIGSQPYQIFYDTISQELIKNQNQASKNTKPNRK